MPGGRGSCILKGMHRAVCCPLPPDRVRTLFRYSIGGKIDKRSTNREKMEEIKGLLARAPLIRGACELDLLVFLHRHPRTLLTIEQLAVFVGYDAKQVAKVIDVFIDAGVLERTHNPTHAARMYLLVLNGPQGGGLTTLLQLASTRQGRRNILEVLGPEQSQAAPVDTARGKAKRRLYAIA